ncbi:hypothetical protein, partial [Acetobacter orientalis]
MEPAPFSSLLPDAPAPPAAPARRRVSVLLPMPFAGPFDYAAPPNMPLNPGDVVVVPLGRRRETGVVWEPNPN